jgi:hypothetical protein
MAVPTRPRWSAMQIFFVFFIEIFTFFSNFFMARAKQNEIVKLHHSLVRFFLRVKKVYVNASGGVLSLLFFTKHAFKIFS